MSWCPEQLEAAETFKQTVRELASLSPQTRLELSAAAAIDWRIEVVSSTLNKTVSDSFNKSGSNERVDRLNSSWIREGKLSQSKPCQIMPSQVNAFAISDDDDDDLDLYSLLTSSTQIRHLYAMMS